MRNRVLELTELTAMLALAAPALFAAEQQTAFIGDLRLESGAVIQDCRLGYRTIGTLNADKSNAVLFPTWFSGRSETLENYVGPDKMVDPARFFVILVDALGNGVSSSPSLSAGAPLPKFTIRDMVNSQHKLLTGKFGINRLHAVVGISMGGMQTFEWMVAYPGFMKLAVPIVGSPRLASSDLLLWQAELSAIELAESCGCDRGKAMKTVNAIHQFAVQTPEYRHHQTPASDFPKYKESFEKAGVMAPEDWASQLRAMMSHDVSRGFGGSLDRAAAAVSARTLIVVATQDHMVNAAPAIDFAGMLPGAQLLKLEGNCGHLAIGCESAKMTPRIREFLAR